MKSITNNKNIVVLSGDKDSSVVIMDKTNYVIKVGSLIEEGIEGGKYIKTADNAHKDLHNFQCFLQNHFSKHKEYNKMRPNSNQPTRLFATAKTHKFSNFADININNLKIRPIVDQTGAHTHAAAKVISDYLQLLTNNEYVITNTLTFADSIKSVNLSHSEEFRSVGKVDYLNSKLNNYHPKEFLDTSIISTDGIISTKIAYSMVIQYPKDV